MAILHIVNNPGNSGHRDEVVPLYSGATDAMVQWWYGHNAVGFFLTAGFLGIMYYLCRSRPNVRSIPIACRSSTSGTDHRLHLGRPAPPAYTALPDWAQSRAW